jgi:hypothetical protein
MRFGSKTKWFPRLAGVALALPMAAGLAAAQGKSVHLCDFEDIPMVKWSDTVYDIPTALKKPNYPSNDYDWNTGGYARLEPAEKREAFQAKNEALGRFMRGNYAVKVRFSVPSEFRVMGTEDDPQSWESGMTLSTETPTSLALTDWTNYKSISLDVYNPSQQDRQLFVRVSDSNSTTYQRSAVLKPGEARLQLPLTELDQQRINLADIRAITLFMDTASYSEPPALYMDNLQLNTELLPEYTASGDEEEEEFEFEEDEDDELSEEALRKYGGRLKQAPLK